jgi:uroporphyrinogen III methyltransferase/synthase
LPEELRKAGAEVRILPVYETGLNEQGPESLQEKLDAGDVDYVTFTSSSTVDNFFQLLPPEELKKHLPQVKLACIGPVTAKTLEGYGFTPDIQPEDYTIPALADALASA